MKSIFIICIAVSFCACALCAAGSKEVAAYIDGVPMYLNAMSEETAKMLPEPSQSGDIREIRVRAAVEFELKIRTSLEILAEEKISCSTQTAQWYIAERCRKYGNENNVLKDGLEKLVNDRAFQLKCAIYCYVKKKYPERVVVTDAEAESRYRINQMAFLRRTPGKFIFVKMKENTPDTEKQLADIRAALLQGESINSVIRRFNAVCTDASLPVADKLSEKTAVYENFVSDILYDSGVPGIAVCIKAPGKSYIPYAKMKPLIEEELISHRAGAVFDDILKQRLSRKNIKYRR